LNSGKIGKIWKKGKLNSEKIWKKYGRNPSWIVIRFWKYRRNCEMIWKLWKKPKLNSDKIWKIQKKIVKWYEKYGRKVGWIVKRFWKYRRKLWNDMENAEEK
jgi:hypothetical protein